MTIYFNEHFDRPTIVYCIVDTVYTVLADINLVISETACQLKKDPSLMLQKVVLWKNFSDFDNFPPGLLPTIRQVIKAFAQL